jgi:hypothetical protein
LDRQERAELAVRVVALVVLVYAAAELVMLGYPLLLWLGPAQSHSGGALVLTSVASLVLPALIGAALMAWPTAMARLLVPRPSEGEDAALGELMRLGMFAVAVRALLGLLTYGVNAVPGRPLYLVCAGANGLLAVVFLVRPRPLTAWLMAGTRAREGWSLAGALGMGLALVALYKLARHAEMLVSLPGTIAATSQARDWSGAQSHAWLVQGFVGDGLGLALWGLMLGCCGPVGRWLAAGAPEGARPVLRALGRGNWTELTLQASVLFVVLTILIPWGIGAFRLQSSGSAWLPVVVPVIAVGLLVAAARLGAALARAFYPALSERFDLEPEDAVYLQSQEEPSDRHSLLVAVEVAITVIAIDYIASYWWMPYGTGWLYKLLRPLLLVALLLVLRGDIARWCVRPIGDEEDARPRRQAALYPWLGLLGVVLALGAAWRLATLIALLSWTLGRPPDVEPATASTTDWAMRFGLVTARLAIGLALVFARRPLSRLLAYGPLLHGNGVIGHGLKSD